MEEPSVSEMSVSYSQGVTTGLLTIAEWRFPSVLDPEPRRGEGHGGEGRARSTWAQVTEALGRSGNRQELGGSQQRDTGTSD